MSFEFLSLAFKPVAKDISIAQLMIKRPRQANAMNAKMLEELSTAFDYITKTPGCRALVLSGSGKHFCAGADLKWMQDSAKLSFEENMQDAGQLTEVFEKLANLSIPTIAVTKGAVYGGAVGLVAACDITLAQEGSLFCLSEVKVGLIPAVILPYLSRRMLSGALKRYSLSGRVFSALEAFECGLVDRVFDSKSSGSVLTDELNALLQAGPEAQKQLKALHRVVVEKNGAQGDYTRRAIATVRTAPEGQSGLQAFFDKQPPAWQCKIDNEWNLNDGE